MIKQFTNLEEEIKKLNAPTTSPAFIDEETGEFFKEDIIDSLYEFTYKVENNHISIYDRNEYFNMYLDDEIRAIVYYGCKEFGVEYKTPESTTEKIINIFKSALEKDLKESIVIEWQDNITLSVYL